MDKNPTKKMSKRDFGIAGLIGVIAGRMVVASSTNTIIQHIGSILMVVGIVCLGLWLYRVIARKP
jgi:hypothetical protein